ncbi:MAG: heme ABC transporter ATP-binding protein [Bauldia litoralis]|uniref:heme ABC transporter ATP-binding protein n=2 Tax=Bauldia litoralis TaxID=665467 RepID=UPI00329A2A42
MYVAEDISRRAGGKTILDGVSLGLPPGTVTVLVGPNGAGKSTLLRIMAGGLPPSRGRVLLHGRDLAAWRPAELAGVRSVLSQSTGLAFGFRVEDVVRMGLPRHGVAEPPAALVAWGLEVVGLADAAGRDCTTLSGGEQQRVHLARVLVQLKAAPADGRARYLFLDEPTTGLDLAHQLLLLDIARRHARAGGGVLAVLHDLNLAAQVADTVVALDGGRVVAEGTPEAVITDRLLTQVYGVDLRVNQASARVFVLPVAG